MNKKFLKIYFIIILVIIIITNISYGFTIEDLTGTQPTQLKEVEKVGKSMVKVLSTIGTAVSIIFLIILGIKYMIGSTEEKAQYKKTLLPYFIGAMFVFGASVIAGAIYNMFA